MRLRRSTRHESRSVARIAFNMRPVERPWGGGNWFLRQLVAHLTRSGYAVQFELTDDVDCIVALDPRTGDTVPFAAAEIRRHKEAHPDTLCLHRVNENDAHRLEDGMDHALAELNAVADQTVFVSRWLRDYHAERWFDLARPHTFIHNGADPAVYHPIGSETWRPGEPLRLVTHHWSDNRFKGFPVYAEIDSLIAGGALPDTELWVIGRWPADVTWRAARTWPPTSGADLANLLRGAHVYVTASLWDPGPMHVAEGARCGLPFLYHEDGGGIVEVASRFGIGFRDDVAGGVAAMRERYGELRAAALAHAPSGDEMCAAYRGVIERLLADR